MIKDGLTYQVAVNRQCPGEKLGLAPLERRWARYNGTFVAEVHTPASHLDQIIQGYSFTALMGRCSGLCCGEWCTNGDHKEIAGHCGRPEGYRKNQHFLSAPLIALDFDTGDDRSSINYLARQPLIAQHGTFLYTTLSHTPEHPKARAVFIIDSEITDPDLYRRFTRAVMAQLPWGDASVHDPARMFYGSHPRSGQTLFLGNRLPTMVLNDLVEEHRIQMEAEQPRRDLPRISAGRVLGSTPAERYVNSAIQQEVAWVSSQIEGTGERHKGLLIASMKLGSLSLAEWLPAEARESIDACALLMPAATANGYIAKYGEVAARQTISDGIAYASPRPDPVSINSSKPRLRFSGGRWVKAVRA